MTEMRNPVNIVEFKNLHTFFFTGAGTVKSVSSVSFRVPFGRTAGVVDESSCSKSMTSLSLMQLLQHPQGQVVEGSIHLNTGDKVYETTKTPENIMQHLRGSFTSTAFQEPVTLLDPVFCIGDQMNEVTMLHKKNEYPTKEAVRGHMIRLLKIVDITNSEDTHNMYPHKPSGSMRQRVMTAMALACSLKFIIADEPTTVLDVTTQVQILDLLHGPKDKINSSITLITHNLGVIAKIANYVVVMYSGRVVEAGTAEEIFSSPAHPYAIGLMVSKPVIDKHQDKLYPIPGKVLNPINMPNYCCFHDRYNKREGYCDDVYPGEIWSSETHRVSCYHYDEVRMGSGQSKA